MAKIRLEEWTPLRIWQRLGMDVHTLLMMMKGALAPTIVIAMYQATSVANVTVNFGYLSAIMAVMSQGLQPRARFMKIMLFIVLATCVAASLACLGIFCAVTARNNTTPPGASPTTYNSSASAVSAIWFIFDIWIGNAMRARNPTELQGPIASYSIFISVTMTRAARIMTVGEGLDFVRNILLAFLLGFAIATGVSLFILPTTSRGIVFNQLKSYPETVKSLLDAQSTYLSSTESGGPWRLARRATLVKMVTRRSTRAAQASGRKDEKDAGSEDDPCDFEFSALQSAIDRLNEIHSKAHSEMHYAKQEIVWGNLTAEDISKLVQTLRSILLPLSGIAMLPDVFRRLTKAVSLQAEGFESICNELPDDFQEVGEDTKRFVRPLCDRSKVSAKLVHAGLLHAFVVLRLIKPKAFRAAGGESRFSSFPRDEEGWDRTVPGREGFAAHFERQINVFYAGRKQLPQQWASLNAFAPASPGGDAAEYKEIRKEFFAILFIGHLQDTLLRSVFDLVKFADSKVADGSMKQKRLIFPKSENFKQWLFGGGSDGDESANNVPIVGEKTDRDSFLGREDPLRSRFADPEHLPPVNKWQKFGKGLRRFSNLLSSSNSAFGLRVALASFSAAILAYLAPTQDFFYHNRINWTVFVIVIAMNPISGKSLFGLMGRIFGTVFSTGLSFAVWYMVAGKTPGVLVFLYVANCIQFYFYVKFPRFIPACVIALITFNLIIAYELQVRKLGVAVSGANGLTVFPIYLFGPYRLLAVTAGCAIAFLWIIFPRPTTAVSQVRKSLGRSLFVLANFYNCMHTSIDVWINQEQGDVDDPQSPANLLQRARNTLFSEEIGLLADIRSHGEFTKYEPAIGGRFPKKTYDAIADDIRKVLTGMDLMAHVTRNLERLDPSEVSLSTDSASSDTSSDHTGSQNTDSGTGSSLNGEGKWIQYLARATTTPGFHPDVITSVLYHLSAAVSNGLSLPPYLAPSHAFPLAKHLRQIDENLLDIQNVEDPAFSAFVSVEVMSSMVSSNLKHLVSNVKSLVGELNFDIYVKRHRRRLHDAQRRSRRNTANSRTQG